jgi:hypothetical protein
VNLTHRARVPAIFSGEAVLEWMMTVFWRSPAMERDATMIIRSRRRWWRNEDHEEIL